MKFEQILNEGVIVHGNELVAYAMVVAEEYHFLPERREQDIRHWEAMVSGNETMLTRIMSDVEITWSTNDPYPNQRELMFDILVNKRARIYGTQDDGSQVGSHPGITNQDNNVLRAVHDYLTHWGPNAGKFKEYVKKNDIKDITDKKFKALRFSRNSFTVRGEMNAYLTHSKVAPRLAIPALFTEVVGQICVYFVTGDYTVNKASVMHGIDFQNIGRFTDPDLEKRKQQYLTMLNDKDVELIHTRIPGVTIHKSKIRWKLLSRGEGMTH